MNRPSYHKVNYSLRPAKAVERKIILEMLQGLRAFATLSEYAYCGFGSIYFSDFSLFHRGLSFSHMSSIEGNVEDEERVRFNLPFNCIDLKLGRSDAILPTLSWDRRVVVWLDYDHELARYVLNDVETVVNRARSGSVLLVTVDVESRRLQEPRTVEEVVYQDWPEDEQDIDRICRLVGEENISPAVRELDTRGDGLAESYRRIVADRIERSINRINIGRNFDGFMRAEPFFNMIYQDGARMATFGWILFVEAERARVDNSGLRTHTFSAIGGEPRVVELPNLTLREIHALDRLSPNGEAAENGGERVPVPEEDRQKFSLVYRYYPRFTEAAL